jgi:hypothetical protein
MRIIIILLMAVLTLNASAQLQENRIDPFVNVFFGIYPIKVKGIDDISNGNSQGGIPIDPNYTTVEANGMVLATMVQAGLDLNVLMKDDMRMGLRAGGGIGMHSGVKNADGMETLAFEAMGLGFYRRVLGEKELTGLLGYKRVWSVLPFHFLIIGAEYSWDEHWGFMLSTSINQQKYWRRFSNGFEEPAFAIREIGLTLVFRY